MAFSKRPFIILAIALTVSVGICLLYLERTRLIEGTLLGLKEHGRLLENQRLADACNELFDEAPQLAYPLSGSPGPFTTYQITQPIPVTKGSRNLEPTTVYFVKFVGRWRNSRPLSWNFLLNGSSDSTQLDGGHFEVDRMISMEELPSGPCYLP